MLAGWKVLCEMAGQEVWGRPPSAQTLLLVLQGLAAQLGEGGPELEDLLAFTQRVVADLAAATGTGSGSSMDESSSASAVGGPPALPPLDAQLAAAALRLLLAAGDAANDAGRGGGVLAAGVQVVMQALAAAQQPLSTELCEAVLAAFEADPSLEEWARQEFGAEAVDELEMQALGEGLGAPLVLRQLERQGAQESLGDGEWGVGALVHCALPMQRIVVARTHVAGALEACVVAGPTCARTSKAPAHH